MAAAINGTFATTRLIPETQLRWFCPKKTGKSNLNLHYYLSEFLFFNDQTRTDYVRYPLWA